MSTLMYQVQAVSDLCVVTTFVYADNEDQAERMGLEQISDQLGMGGSDVFQEVNVELEEAE